jgi:hypothetical protein
MSEQLTHRPGEDSMERMMDGMNGGMETTAPMPDMGMTDGGGAAERPRPKRSSSRPKAAKKSKPKAKARKSGAKRPKAKVRAKAGKAGRSKTAKKRGRRR